MIEKCYTMMTVKEKCLEFKDVKTRITLRPY